MNRIALLTFLCAIALVPGWIVAQDEPKLVPDVVDFQKLLPILPEAPSGWTAEKPEGSTTDAGGAKITTVHRDYKKGAADTAPTTSISIIDAAANPEFVTATTGSWNITQTTTEGYAKSINIEANPSFETYDNEPKHGSLWLLVARRYLLQVDINGQEAKELQQWLKRIDLKKLAEIK